VRVERLDANCVVERGLVLPPRLIGILQGEHKLSSGGLVLSA
jgi:hypothetical protein